MPPRPCLHCGGLIPFGRRCSCRTNEARGYGSEWRKIRQAILARDGGQCIDCGHTGSPANPLTVDHVMPKARGGGDNPDNLVTRCRIHNSSKGIGSKI